MCAENDHACPNAAATPPKPDDTTPGDDLETRDTASIRRLNDRLRKTGQGGQVLITDGILEKGLEFARKVVEQVADFDNFSEDNDPWDEHDCAGLEVDVQRILWKIDYYDKRMEFLSPNPADPKVTCRVLTIMLSCEY